MSQALLALLLSVLLARSHELCRDEIISTLFSILNNDPTRNFLEFLTKYFEQSNIQTVLNEKHRRILLENYSRNETVRIALVRREFAIKCLSSRIYHRSVKISMILFMIIDITQSLIPIE